MSRHRQESSLKRITPKQGAPHGKIFQRKPSLLEILMEKVAPGIREIGPLGPDLKVVEALETKLSALEKSMAKNIKNLTSANGSAYGCKELGEIPYAVCDLETTGLRPYNGDEIISIGAVLLDGEELSEATFHRLVNPGRPIPAVATKITGITSAEVQSAPPVEEVLVHFLDFIGDRVLVAHHALFELTFLNLKLMEILGHGLPHPTIDTARLTRYLEPPSLEEHSLENLCRYYRISPEGRHTALGDARITADIFLLLLQRLKENGIQHLEELAQLCYYSPTDFLSRYPLILS